MGELGVDESLRDELRKLERVVADLRAESAIEAAELRARVRDLERRVEAVTGSALSASGGRTSKASKSERARVRELERRVEQLTGSHPCPSGSTARPDKPPKTERAAKKREARAARHGQNGPLPGSDGSAPA